MGETILLIVVLLLALYGCTELIRWLAVRLLQPPVKDRSLRVLPVAGRRDDLDALCGGGDPAPLVGASAQGRDPHPGGRGA